MMLLAMSSVLPSFNSINYGLPSLKSSLPSLSSSARHLSPSATWSNRHSGVSKGTRPRISSNSGGLVRNLGTLLPEQFLQSYDSSSELTYHSTSTVTPRLSPQPHSRLELSVESDSAVVWSMPTPPRSESGPTTRSPAVAGSYSLTTATGNSDAPATRPSMSTLNYMGQPQYQQYSHDGQLYAPASYSYDQGYRIPAPSQHVPQSYDLSEASSSYRQNASRAASQSSAYQSSDQSLSVHNPYGLGYGQSHSSTQRSMSSPMPATTTGLAGHSKYPSAYPSERSPTFIDPRYYVSPSTASQAVPTPTPTTLAYIMPQYGNAPQPQTFQRSDSITSAGSLSTRPIVQKEKPQCWEHGCNGREFSTFSNLLRHQREKSGTASKSSCPRCGAEFTRTTARNGHLAHDKCTRRRPSEDEK